jgi:hypothetical protein
MKKDFQQAKSNSRSKNQRNADRHQQHFLQQTLPYLLPYFRVITLFRHLAGGPHPGDRSRQYALYYIYKEVVHLPCRTVPAGCRPAPTTDEFALFSQVRQQHANPIATDSGASTFNIGKAKIAWLGLNRLHHQFRLCAPRRRHFPDALFKLMVCILQRVEQEIDVR